MFNLFKREPATAVRCGLLNTGELCIIDGNGHVQTYSVDSTRVIRDALLASDLPGDDAAVLELPLPCTTRPAAWSPPWWPRIDESMLRSQAD